MLRNEISNGTMPPPPHASPFLPPSVCSASSSQGVRTYPARNTKLASPPIMARREEPTLPPFLHVG